MSSNEDELHRGERPLDVRDSASVLGVGGTEEESQQDRSREGGEVEEDSSTGSPIEVYPDTTPSDPISGMDGVPYVPSKIEPEKLSLLDSLVGRVLVFLVRGLGSGRVTL